MTNKQSRSLAKSTAKKPVENTMTSISKKKKEPMINAPPESPSTEELMETEEDEDQTDSSSEEEDHEPKPKDSGKNPQSLPVPEEEEEEEEEEETDEDESGQSSAPIVAATEIPSSHSESGSETEGGESDAKPEPASTKPPPPPPSASPSTSRKRKIEATASPPDANPTITNRGKKQTETDTAKKGLFQRVWSEQDEIALLEAVLAFKEETGTENVSGVYKMVKDSTFCKGKNFDQFFSKVAKLKGKYLGKKNYTKAHALKCLDLCEKIWVTGAIVKSEKKKKKVEDVSIKLDDGVKRDSDWFESSYLFRAMMAVDVVNDESLKKKWSLVPVEMKNKLEEEFKVLEASSYDLLMLKTKFLQDVSCAIGNA